MLIAILIVSSVSAYNCGTLAGDALKACNKYNKMEEEISDNCKYNKDQLPWCASYVMRSYLEMYTATKDTYYLDKFVDLADNAVSLMDINNGDKDFEGNSVAGWSQDSDTGQPYRHAVHSGMITYPMACFARIVRDEGLSDYDSHATNYVTAIANVIEAHDRTYGGNMYKAGPYEFSKWSISSNKGSYYWRSADPVSDTIRGWNVPTNQNLVMGSTLIVMYDLTGNLDYKDKAKRLGQAFYNDLDEVSCSDGNCIYLWHYWWGDSLALSGKYEDVSHGRIDVEFALEAYNSGFNVNSLFPTKDQIGHFARTFKSKLYISPTELADRVDGTVDGSKNPTPDDAMGYIDLALVSPTVYLRTMEMFKLNGLDGGKIGALGWAKLAKWAATERYCEESGSCVCGDGICNSLEGCDTCADDCGICATCGNGVCDDVEDCSTCTEDCKASHDSDKDPCNGCVSISELISYMDEWKSGTASLTDVMGAISAWKSGC